MSSACGKKARATYGGNRYDVQRHRRNTKFQKMFHDNHLSPEEYQTMKLKHKKELAKRRKENKR